MNVKETLPREVLTAFESVPDRYLILSPELVMLTASDAYLAATRQERETIRGCFLFAVSSDHPAARHLPAAPDLRASLQRVLDTRKPDRLARHYVNTPVLDEQGDLVYIIHKLEAVTEPVIREQPAPVPDGAEQNQTEEALRLAHHRLVTIFGAVPLQIGYYQVVRNAAGDIDDLRSVAINDASVSKMSLEDGGSGQLMSAQLPGLTQLPVWQTIKQVIDTRQPHRMELHHDFGHADAWFDVLYTPLEDGIISASLDITERKKAEQALRESQGLLRTTVDSSFHFIQVFNAVRDEQGLIVDFTWLLTNKKWNDAYGDVIGKSLLEQNPAVVQTGLFDKFVAVTQTGIPYLHEHQYDYEQFTGWFHQIAVKQGDGFVLTTEDITDRKKNQQQLLDLKNQIAQQATDRYFTLFNAIDEGFYLCEVIFDEHNQVIDIRYLEENPAAVRMGGMSVIGKTLRQINPNYEAFWFQTWGEVALTGESNRMEHFSGPDQKWFTFFITKVGDEASRQVAVVFQDSTDLKKAQQELEQNRDLLQSVFDVSYNGLSVLKSVRDGTGELVDMEYLLANRATKKTNQRDDLEGKLYSSVHAGFKGTDYFEVVKRVVETGEPHHYQLHYNFEHLDHWYNITTVKLDDGVVISFEDISTEKKAELALQERTEQKAFLLRLSDALKSLSDPFELQKKAVQILGTQLQADRVFYCRPERDGDFDYFVIDYMYGSPHSDSVLIRVSVASLNQQQVSEGGSGTTLVIADVETDPSFTEAERVTYRQMRIRAYIAYPLMREGALMAYLCVHQMAVRHWTEQEVTFVIETAERTWDAVQRARAELALRGSEDRYRTLFNSMDEGFQHVEVLYDQADQPVDYRFLTQNPAADRMLMPTVRAGLRASEVAPAVNPEWLRICDSVARTGEPVRKQVYDTNMDRWFDFYMARSGDPSLRQTVVLFQDVTARKEAEETLRRLEERARIALEAAGMGTWEWNLLTNEVYWNEQHFWLFGMTPPRYGGGAANGPRQPLTPDDFTRHVHPDDLDRVQGKLERTIREKIVYNPEFRAVRDDGSIRWMSSYGHVTDETDGQATRLSGVTFDIDDRKQAEEALRESVLRKDEFLAMLAHELRNPLAPIRNVLQLLRLTRGADETVGPAVTMMSRQVEHLIRLVDDLLDVSRISRGKVDLRRQRLDLVVVVQQAVEATRPLYASTHRQLTVSLPPSPLYVNGDATRLTQVVNNLLTNGARYTTENGQVTLSLDQVENEARLRVSDNGIGLAADQLRIIFELFAQIDTSLARSQGGLGLGLTLVEKLTQMHGGRVEARSAGLGQGSEFLVYLPLFPESEQPVITAGRATPAGVSTCRILVVDDNRDAADTLAMLLKLARNEVHTRYSGQEAVDAGGQIKPEVVLLDIGMPGLDGYATARLIREQPWGHTIVLIALTGYGQEEDKRLSQQAGFDAHLVKPVDLAELAGLLTGLRTNPGANPERSDQGD